ncbi:hypothetical protein [Lichenibacterium dinghuense]|uniref:hypothetical protein n=1 Tax=Lichenibacterium dinghuense TaxID=2895977 RepID=UPI001F327710|nr:hypothetical protein [Lichenibacterium sp. 6Y81]
MSRPALTPRAVSAAMAATAALLGPELRGGAGLAGSLRLRAHAVEAVLQVHPAVGPDAALVLCGVAGADAALRVAAVMSGEGWQPRLAAELARLLRLLDAHPAVGRPVDRSPAGVDLAPALMGDPEPGRSARGLRSAGPHEARNG